jgi:hypothetical protein
MLTAVERTKAGLVLRNKIIPECRRSVTAFSEFVMWEERTQQRVKIAPHQEVMISFMTHPKHRRCVLLIPPGFSKTSCEILYALWLAGHNSGLRSMFVSKAQGQAMKPLAQIGAYITGSNRLKCVFPGLRRSRREQWAQSKMSIDRPAGMRDATFVAAGTDSKQIPGMRLNLIVADDLLDEENTATEEQRKKLYEWFDNLVQPRLDPTEVSESRLIVSNTAWHPKDLLHQLWGNGWPTLRMDVEGGVYFYNVDPGWDYGRMLRPKMKGTSEGAEFRLRAHEPDLSCTTPLWPELFGREEIEERRRTTHPLQFNRAYMSNCRDDSTAAVKQAWIDECKRKARERGHHAFRSAPFGGGAGKALTFTGVDLAFSKEDRSDDTCFFTFEVLPTGERLILDIDVGKFDGPTIIKKIKEKAQRYDSIIRIENNAGQRIVREWALNEDVGLKLTKHETGRNKGHPEHGVQSLFVEIANGAWLIPNDSRGNCPPAVQRWVDACLYYVADNHTDDVLMASWFAHEQARIAGALWAKKPGTGQAPPAVGAGILAR